jgi:hypothetical protein
VCFLGFSAAAQPQSPPPDLAKLPEEIRSLPWQSIDLSSVAPQEQDRALLLMNHVLGELSALRTSEADLMSNYIQEQNLGTQFAKSPPRPAATQLQYSDGLKIAVALLRGPMANSSYASEFTGASAEGLAAYQQMYDATCRRRWSELEEARAQLRGMSAFLGKLGKLKDYQTWAKSESQKRQQQYEQSMAQKQATEHAFQAQYAVDEKRAAAQQAQLDAANRQLQEALAAAHQQEQQQAAQLQQEAQQRAAQQAAQVQQQAANTQQPNYPLTQPEAPGLIPGAEEPDGWYGGWYAPVYYPAGTSWYRDGAYAGAARTQIDQRVSGWHGAPAAGVRR